MKDDKNKTTYSDEIDDKSFKQSSELSMRLAVRAFIHKISFFALLGAIAINLLSKLDEKGLRIYDILGKPAVSKTTSKIWLNILSQKFSEETLAYPLYGVLIFSLIMILYYVILAKTTEFKLNFRCLQVESGVLNRTLDTIDLVSIKDQVIERPLLFRFLGLSRLIVISKDQTHPTLKISAVDSQKATLFFDYIRQNAYQNATEYWVAKDRRKRNEKKTDSTTPIVGDNDGDANE